MNGTDRVRKLRWLCRRGMKELDILLERFVADQADKLVAGAWPRLESLLAMEDDVLWDQVQNPALAEDKASHELLGIIRDGDDGPH